MRNLKKVLALVLVFVMTFALVFSASAYTYKDQKDIDPKYGEAIDMLYELSIMQGTNGNFKAKANLTRAEMSKMLFVVAYGGKTDASIYSKATSIAGGVPFTDYKDTDWFSGYVNWAYGQKIVQGKSTTKFAPQANITGYEAAKMMLGAIGYLSAYEQYTGTGWKFNVLRDADACGLLEDLDLVDLDQPLTREQAAQMTYNALFIDMVKYDKNNDPPRDNTGKTLAELRFGLQTVTGILVANEWAALDLNATATANASAAAEGKIRLDTSGAGYTNLASNTLSTTADLSLLGREVKVYVKGTWSNAATPVLTVSKVYGHPLATGEDTVAEMSVGDLTDTATDLEFEYDDEDYTIKAKIGATFVNYTGNDIPGDFTALAGDNPVRAIIDGDGVVRYLFATNFTFIQVTNSVDSKITFKLPSGTAVTGASNLKKANCAAGSDLIVKDGYALYATVGSSKYALTAVTEITGLVTGTSNLGKNAVIGGKTYVNSDITGAESNSTSISIASGFVRDGKEHVFLTYGSNLLMSNDDAVSSETLYGVVTAVAETLDAYDGTLMSATIKMVVNNNGAAEVKSFKLDAIDDVAIGDGIYAADGDAKAAFPNNCNKLVTYKLNEAGDTVEVKNLDPASADYNYEPSYYLRNTAAGSSRMSVGATAAVGTTAYFSSGSVFFVKYVNDWYVFVSNKLPQIEALSSTNGVVADVLFSGKTVTTDDTIAAAVIVGTATTMKPVTSGTSTDIIGLLYENAGSDYFNNKWYAVYKAIDKNGNKVTYYSSTLGGATATTSGANVTSTNVPTYGAGSLLVGTAVGGTMTIDGVTGIELTKYAAPVKRTDLSAVPDTIAANSHYAGYITGLNASLRTIILSEYATSDTTKNPNVFQVASDVKIVFYDGTDFTTSTAFADLAESPDTYANGKFDTVVVFGDNSQISAIYVNTAGRW